MAITNNQNYVDFFIVTRRQSDSREPAAIAGLIQSLNPIISREAFLPGIKYSQGPVEYVRDLGIGHEILLVGKCVGPLMQQVKKYVLTPLLEMNKKGKIKLGLGDKLSVFMIKMSPNLNALCEVPEEISPMLVNEEGVTYDIPSRDELPADVEAAMNEKLVIQVLTGQYAIESWYLVKFDNVLHMFLFPLIALAQNVHRTQVEPVYNFIVEQYKHIAWELKIFEDLNKMVGQVKLEEPKIMDERPFQERHMVQQIYDWLGKIKEQWVDKDRADAMHFIEDHLAQLIEGIDRQAGDLKGARDKLMEAKANLDAMDNNIDEFQVDRTHAFSVEVTKQELSQLIELFDMLLAQAAGEGKMTLEQMKQAFAAINSDDLKKESGLYHMLAGLMHHEKPVFKEGENPLVTIYNMLGESLKETHESAHTLYVNMYSKWDTFKAWVVHKIEVLTGLRDTSRIVAAELANLNKAVRNLDVSLQSFVDRQSIPEITPVGEIAQTGNSTLSTQQIDAAATKGGDGAKQGNAPFVEAQKEPISR